VTVVSSEATTTQQCEKGALRLCWVCASLDPTYKALALSAGLNAPIPDMRFGVFRM
jgi:hypothetical protein